MADEDVTVGGKTFAADLVTVEGEIKRVARDKIGWGAPGTYNDTDVTHPLPVSGTDGAGAATNLATQATLAAVLAKLSADPATQTTLAAVLAAVDGLEANTTGLASQTTAAAVLAKLSADPATQTTLAAVLAKLSADPATQTTLAAALTAIQALVKPADLSNLATIANQTAGNTKLDALHTDLGLVATQTTAAAILAKLSSDPATQTTLAAVLTKLGDGTQLQKKTPLTSNAVARVASSATVVTLQTANASRRALKVFNESTAILYIKDGATASLTDYSVQVAAGGYYEWPLPIYTGIVTGLWVSANGGAQVTEGI